MAFAKCIMCATHCAQSLHQLSTVHPEGAFHPYFIDKESEVEKHYV